MITEKKKMRHVETWTHFLKKWKMAGVLLHFFHEFCCHFHALLAGYTRGATFQVAALPSAVELGEGCFQFLCLGGGNLNSTVESTAHTFRCATTTTGFHGFCQVFSAESCADSLGAVVHERRFTESGKCFFCWCHNLLVVLNLFSDKVPHTLALGIEVVLVVLVGGNADGHLLLHCEAVTG